MKNDGGELWSKILKPIIVFIYHRLHLCETCFVFKFTILKVLLETILSFTNKEMAPDVAGNKNESQTNLYRSRFQHFQTGRNLKRESERLKTFINWTVSYMDPKNLAKNGFYYTNMEDVVRCAFCDVLIGSWEMGDVPEEDHLKHSPECPFINGIECGNVVLTEGAEEPEDNKQEEEVMSEDVCGSYGLEIRPFSAPERRELLLRCFITWVKAGKTPLAIELTNLWTDFEELGVSKISGPVTPHYATLNARLKTYSSWPIPEIQSAEKLAEAGFYYTSFQDNVLCFHCGGGLKNWEVDDDPWVEHARWFSRCGFVILRKGREFVNEILEKEKPQTAEKGCEGNQELKGVTLEKKELAPPTSSTSPSASSASTSNSDKESQLSQSPNGDGKELELCRICYVRERGIVFLPCGHFVSCTQCAPSLSSCAVCRKPFEATVRAYLS